MHAQNSCCGCQDSPKYPCIGNSAPTVLRSFDLMTREQASTAIAAETNKEWSGTQPLKAVMSTSSYREETFAAIFAQVAHRSRSPIISLVLVIAAGSLQPRSLHCVGESCQQVQGLHVVQKLQKRLVKPYETAESLN